MIALALVMMAHAVAGAPTCDNPATQAEMNQCSAQEYHRADAALNLQWKSARNVAKDRDAWEELLKAQRLWLSFRDAHCEAVSARYAGGSIRPLIHNNCMTELTERRTEQLHQMSEMN